MTFLTRHLKQIATLWTVSNIDSFGDPSFNSPVEINVRWEDRTELFINMDGAEERSQAVVFLSIDVTPGDFLMLGSSTEADPLSIRTAYMVKSFRKIPGLGGDKFERRAIL